MKRLLPILFVSTLALATPPLKSPLCRTVGSLDGRLDNALITSRAFSEPGMLAEANAQLLPSFEKQLRKSVEAGKFEADKYAGQMLPLQENILPRFVALRRSQKNTNPVLSPETMKTIEAGKRYIYVVVREGDQTKMYLEQQDKGASHREVGFLHEAVSAGEIVFREVHLDGGKKLMVIDHVNLQSGLYRPAAIRILETYRALVAAGLDVRQIATGRFDSGEQPPKGGGNIPIFDFGDHVPLL